MWYKPPKVSVFVTQSRGTHHQAPDCYTSWDKNWQILLQSIRGQPCRNRGCKISQIETTSKTSECQTMRIQKLETNICSRYSASNLNPNSSECICSRNSSISLVKKLVYKLTCQGYEHPKTPSGDYKCPYILTCFNLTLGGSEESF